MGAHHAPVRSARHDAALAAPTTPAPTPGVGRLAGTGVLTASAALALTSAGSGVALAQDSDETSGTLGDNDVSLLCGLLGGDECSSDSTDDASRDSDAGSSDDVRSLFDRVTDRGGSSPDADRSEGSDTGGRSSTASTERSSGDAPGRSDAPSPSSAPQRDAGAQARPSSRGAPSSSLDTPPPPGQVRTIQVPG